MACVTAGAAIDAPRVGVSSSAPAQSSSQTSGRPVSSLPGGLGLHGPQGLSSLQRGRLFRTSRSSIRSRQFASSRPSVQCSAFSPLSDAAQQVADAASTSDITALVPLENAADVATSLAQAVDLTLTSMSLAVGVGLPCHFMECGDVTHRSTLSPDDPIKLTVGGILLLTIIVGYLWSTPGVAPGFWDMFVLAPLERRFRPSLKKSELVLGKKLGEGAFGTVYKAKVANDAESEVVVKRANEFGAVEIWMNERVRRACPNACAAFVSGFVDRTKYNEDFWLVWQYEGDSTFAKILEAKDFPYNVEMAVLGYTPNEPKGPKREMRVVRRLMRKILESLQQLHATGIVHRDMKPQNMIFNSESGSLKVIDLGAAADLRVGINYSPNEFLLDPRYAAPEQYIMSKQTPRAPPPPVAAALSPVLWQMNLPDRFDIYSSGLIFLQMVFPSLRSDSGLIQFNRQLKRCDYDLNLWREQAEKRGAPEVMRGFELLDLDGGLGWQLVQSMMRFKGRQRISAKVALLHPYFNPAAPTALQRVRLALLRSVYRDNSAVSEAFVNFMARNGTEDAGGFTELSLQKFRREERKKRRVGEKGSFERNAVAFALKAQRKIDVGTITSTFGGGDPDALAKKDERWWNRWAKTINSKA